MSLRNDFIAWYNNEFKFDPLYLRMTETVEASPWHREKNVGTHTDMVVSEYISWVDKDWTIDNLIIAVACAFHDTGKPSAKVVKFKPERGQYNSFGGHEIISARLFEDYFVRNAERMWELFGVRDLDIIYKIEFVIEHHMPYEQPTDKVQDMAYTTAALFGPAYPIQRAQDGHHFQDHLAADTHGRIADDHEKKIAAVDAWIVEFDKKTWATLHRVEEIRDTKTLILPVGCSGCGKSTLLRKLQKRFENLEHYSWDNLRLEWYDSDYSKAYEMSAKDPKFNARYMKVFNELILTGKNIYVDNTNLSRKRRRPWVDAARKHGYNVVAYVFPNTIDTVIKRQKTRGDKNVPADAVRNHYMTMQVPLIGEVDKVHVENTFA